MTIAKLLEGRTITSIKQSVASHLLIDFDTGLSALVESCAWLVECNGVVVENDDAITNSDIVQEHMQGQTIVRAALDESGMELEIQLDNGVLFTLTGRNAHEKGHWLITFYRGDGGEREAMTLHAPVRKLTWGSAKTSLDYETQNPLYPPVMMASRFREVRKSLGLNQTDMAAMLGISFQATISDYENDKTAPSKSVIRLMEAYANGYRPGDWPTAKRK